MFSREDMFALESNLASQEISYRNRDYFRMLALDNDFHATIFRYVADKLGKQSSGLV